MYSVRVGSSSSLEAITLARQFHATAYRYNGGLSNPGLGRDYIELPRCATVDCIIAFNYPHTFLETLSLLQRDHPKLLDWLPIDTLVWQTWLRRWLPLGAISGPLEVRDGIVKKSEVVMWSGSINGNPCHQAATVISDVPLTSLEWTVVRSTKVVSGAGCAYVDTVEIRVGQSTPHLGQTLSFKLRCLWPGVRCNECEMLPFTCKDSIPNQSGSRLQRAWRVLRFRTNANTSILEVAIVLG